MGPRRRQIGLRRDRLERSLSHVFPFTILGSNQHKGKKSCRPDRSPDPAPGFFDNPSDWTCNRLRGWHTRCCSHQILCCPHALWACSMLCYTPKIAREYTCVHACGEVAERLKAAVC